MKITLTNHGATDQLVADGDGHIFDALEPGEAVDLDGPAVVIVGDKPSVREQLQQAAQVAGKALQKVLDAIRGRAAGTHTDGPETVVFQLENKGANDIRVVLGDGVTDMTVAAGETQTCSAQGYLELRELGLVAQDPNQHEAA